MTQYPGQNASARAEAIPPEHALEGSALDSKDAGGPGDVATGLLQDVGEIASFDLVQRRGTPEQGCIDRVS